MDVQANTTRVTVRALNSQYCAGLLLWLSQQIPDSEILIRDTDFRMVQPTSDEPNNARLLACTRARVNFI